MTQNKYIVYKVRWLLLAGISIGGFSRQFTATAFAIINDTVSHHFFVTNYEVDILSIGDTILAVLVCLFLSMFGKHVRLRAQCLIAISCSMVGNLLTSIAFMSRKLYACVILGRLICGLATGIFYTLPATFANKWFPPKEIATAFSISFSSFPMGGVVSSFLIPCLVPSNNVTSSFRLSHSTYHEHVGSVLSAIFAVVTGLLAGTMIFFCIYAKDSPPSPPSESEAFLSRNTPHVPIDLKLGVREGLLLLKNKPFMLITMGNFMSSTSLVLFVVLMPSLVYATFPSVSNTAIGYVNAAAFCCATASILVAGRILDKRGIYRTLSCIGTGLIIFFGTGIYLGHLGKYFGLLCVSYPLLFLSRSFSLTSYVEFLMEVTYPMDKTVVMSLFFTFYNIAFFATASVERLAFSRCGPNCATLVSIFGNTLTLGCLLFVKPNYKRSWANKGKANAVVTLTELEEKENGA